MKFFEAEPTPNKIKDSKKTKPKSELTCEDCGLCSTCESPKLSFRGNGEKGVLIITDSPMKNEDAAGFYGHSKHLMFLKDTLKELGINLYNDAWVTSAIRCYGKSKPKNALQICSKLLLNEIEQLKPKTVILLGETPFNSLIRPLMRGRINGTSAEAFYGEIIPDQHFKFYICPTYHPSYLLSTRTYEDGSTSEPLYTREPCILDMWKKQLVQAFNSASKSFYIPNYIGDTVTTQDVTQAIGWLKDALSWDTCSFDYETTGIKPFRAGQEILCVSISNGLFSYAFPFFMNNEEFVNAFNALMLSENVKKISHNFTFELLWTKEKLGYWVNNAYWDTMIVAHCIHSQKPTGLKYLVYSKFGDMGYDAMMDEYIESKGDEKDNYGTNAFNRLKEANMDDMLKYCALDSLYTWKLYEMQSEALTDFMLKGFKFFMQSMKELTKATYHGINVNVDIFNKVYIEIDNLMKESYRKIMSSSDVAKWDGEEEFNFNSSKQLSHLLFDILKIKPLTFTTSGAPSVDKEALPLYSKVSFIKDLLEYRKLAKIRDTYLHQYKIECTDGVIHPYFLLHRVDSFRSSSADVNIQQIPKRDKAVMKMLRSFLVPPKGMKLMEFDYKALEVAINACYSNDAGLLRYLSDSSTDMHRDTASDIFILNEVPKEVRQAVKGDMVFATFYGSYFKQTAPALWEFAKGYTLPNGKPLLQHLNEKGISSYSKFESHVERAEKILWNDRFPEHFQWRKDQIAFYKKNGYVELHTGFIVRGPMARNNTFNSPPQGSGYHVLQWTLNKISQKLEQIGAKSYVIGEIHDAMVMCVHPEEEEMIKKWVWMYGTKKVKEYWPWITAPLQIEASESEIDGSWANMVKEYMLGGYE